MIWLAWALIGAVAGIGCYAVWLIIEDEDNVE